MLINIFGTWLNPHKIITLKIHAGDITLLLTEGYNFTIDKPIEDVAQEINKLWPASNVYAEVSGHLNNTNNY